jgi:hypothetical protein
MLGRKVKNLTSDYLQPGNYDVIWNGRNDSGETVSSGFYFYIINTAEFQQSRKMLMLK